MGARGSVRGLSLMRIYRSNQVKMSKQKLTIFHHGVVSGVTRSYHELQLKQGIESLFPDSLVLIPNS